MEPPRLLQFRVSHYNEKVRWALDYKRWPHVRQTLMPGRHMFRARRLSGQTKVPILVLEGRVLVNSRDILVEIERLRPEPALFSTDPSDRARADEIITYFDDVVAPDLRRIFWSAYLPRPADFARVVADGFSTFARASVRVLGPILRIAFRRNMGASARQVAEAMQRLDGHISKLENWIGPSGYLVGERFTVADLTAAAVMTAVLRPPEFAYPLPEPWPPALVELRDRLASRAGARWVYDIYARHRGVSAEIMSVPELQSAAASR